MAFFCHGLLESFSNHNYVHRKDNLYSENKPLIYREEGSATRQAMEKYFKVKHTNTRKKLELTSNEAVKQAIIAGLGYSIIPIIGIKNQIENNEIHIIPQEDLPIKTTWRLIWLKGKNLSPVASAYLDFLNEHKKDIIETHFGWYDKMGL